MWKFIDISDFSIFSDTCNVTWKSYKRKYLQEQFDEFFENKFTSLSK